MAGYFDESYFDSYFDAGPPSPVTETRPRVLVELVDPRYVEFEDWAACMMRSLDRYGMTGSTFMTDWHEFANRISYIPSLSGAQAPDHHQYDDWREWAMQFNYSMIAQGAG